MVRNSTYFVIINLIFLLFIFNGCNNKSTSKNPTATATATSIYTNTYTATNSSQVGVTETIADSCRQDRIASRLNIVQSLSSDGDTLKGVYNQAVSWSFQANQNDNAGHETRIVKITADAQPTEMTISIPTINWTPTTTSPVSGTIRVLARDLTCCNYLNTNDPTKCSSDLETDEDLNKTFTWSLSNNSLLGTGGTLGNVNTGGLGSLLSGGGLGSIMQIFTGLLGGLGGGSGSGMQGILGGLGNNPLFSNFSQIFSGLFGSGSGGQINMNNLLGGIGGGGLGGLLPNLGNTKLPNPGNLPNIQP